MFGYVCFLWGLLCAWLLHFARCAEFFFYYLSEWFAFWPERATRKQGRQTSVFTEASVILNAKPTTESGRDTKERGGQQSNDRVEGRWHHPGLVALSFFFCYRKYDAFFYPSIVNSLLDFLLDLKHETFIYNLRHPGKKATTTTTKVLSNIIKPAALALA